MVGATVAVAAPVAAAVIVIPAKIRRRFVNVDNYFYFNKSQKSGFLMTFYFQ